MADPRDKPTRAPRVSVIMPVRNGDPWLNAAVGSILRQSFGDFELIVVDDGSTDGAVARMPPDTRIRVLSNPGPMGLAASYSRAIASARGEYLARMDADDLSTPERFARQVEALDADPELGVLGGWVRVFGATRPYVEHLPWGAKRVATALLFANPMAHGSVMMRRTVFERHRLRYSTDREPSEDFALWRQCATRMRIDNLPRVLLKYRLHANSITQVRRTRSRAVLLEELGHGLRSIGLAPDAAQMRLHAEAGNGSGMPDTESLERSIDWLARVVEAGIASGKDQEALLWTAGRCAFRICRNSRPLGRRAVSAWRRCRFHPYYRPAPSEWTHWALGLALVGMRRARRRPTPPQGGLGLWPISDTEPDTP